MGKPHDANGAKRKSNRLLIMCKMEDIQKEENKCCFCKVVAGVCFLVSIILIVAGFIVPPTGIIDGSVLTAVGEILLFPTLVYAYRAIELGLEVKFQKGGTSIEIHRDEDGRDSD